MGDTRNEILTVALNLFLQKNYNDVSIEEIAKKLKLTKGAVYYFFKTKKEIFIEAMERFIYSPTRTDFNKFSRDSLYKFYHEYLDDQDKMIQVFFNRKTDKGENTPNMNFYNLWFEALKIEPKYINKYIESNESEIKVWTDVIELAKKNYEIRSDTDSSQIAALFHNIEEGLSIRLVMEERAIDWKREVSRQWDALYKLLKA